MAPYTAAVECIASIQVREAEIRLVEEPAIRGASVPAGTAMAAGLIGQYSVITLSNARHTPSDLLHYARPLMAQNDRCLCAAPAVDEAYIRMADTGSHEAHEDLIIPWTLQFDRFDLQRAAPFAQNGCPNLVNAGWMVHTICRLKLYVFWGQNNPLHDRCQSETGLRNGQSFEKGSYCRMVASGKMMIILNQQIRTKGF